MPLVVLSWQGRILSDEPILHGEFARLGFGVSARTMKEGPCMENPSLQADHLSERDRDGAPSAE